MIIRTFLIALVFTTSLAGQSNFDLENINDQIPQSEEVRNTSSDLLQASLYELIDQYHALQQMHWNTRGQHFISIHELTQEFYTELAGQIDIVAERKLALGKAADGNPERVSKQSDLTPYSKDYTKDYKSVSFLIDRYTTMSNRLGERIKNTPENDLVTQDVFIGLRSTIDHHLFLLRSFSY